MCTRLEVKKKQIYITDKILMYKITMHLDIFVK